MPSFTIEIKRDAQKDMDALPDVDFRRIDTKILALASNPHPAGSCKLQGFKNTWRIHIGDYRVVYVIDEEKQSPHHHARCTPQGSI